MTSNISNNNSIILYSNPNQPKRKLDSQEKKIETNRETILKDCKELDKNLTLLKNTIGLYKEPKKLKKEPKTTCAKESEPTLIANPKLPKYLKKYIYDLLDLNSLNALRLTCKEQEWLIGDLRISWIYKGKLPQDLGFASSDLFVKYIKNHFKKMIANATPPLNIDMVTEQIKINRQLKINRLNKGESLADCEFPSYKHLFSILGENGAKNIDTVADLENHFQNHEVKQSFENAKIKFDVKEWTSKFPNIKRIHLTVEGDINPFPEDILKQINVSFPKLNHLGVGLFSIADANVQEIKKLKNLKVLEITQGNTLSSVDFLDDLTALEELTIDGFSKNINEYLTLPNLRTLHLKNLPELSHLLFLKNCPNLKTLTIEFCPKIEDFNILGMLPNLIELNLAAYTNQDFDFLESIVGLEKLSLINCGNFDPNQEYNWAIDLKFLNTLKSLKFLEIANDGDRSNDLRCENVIPCPSLEILKAENSTFTNNGFFTVDLSKAFPNLHSLDLVYCGDIDYCKFVKFTKLKKLVLYNCDIKILKFIKKLTSLKAISITGCKGLDLKKLEIPKNVKFFTGVDGRTLFLN